MALRLVARVTGNSDEPVVKHLSGWPPELTGGEDKREEMGLAALLLIENKPDGIFLFRFDCDAQCVGDTWHPTVEDAKRQADFEFGNHLSAWRVVPAEVQDAFAFGTK
jgi:hypothetical protein